MPEKKFKEAKNDLQATMKQLKTLEELNRKKEEEYQETIAAMQRRIEELQGMQNFCARFLVHAIGPICPRVSLNYA